MIQDCPFCDEGCCFCDYSGKIRIGVNQVIPTIEAYNEICNSAQGRELREQNLQEQAEHCIFKEDK